jgi:hypothetical protein
MKPKLILCLALVLSGMILNVLVAWSCILWSPNNLSIMPQEKADHTMPDQNIGPDGTHGWWFTGSGFGVWESELSGAEVDPGDNGQLFFNSWRGSRTPAFYRGGWPMLSMQSLVNAVPDPKHIHDTGEVLMKWNLPFGEIVHRGLQTDSLPAWLHVQEGRRLPIVPLWLGFAVDTLLYFLVLRGFYFLLCRIWKLKL